MDDLRRDQFRLLLGDDWTYGVESAVDTALLGRYYERIADHAVAVGSRVIYIVTGEAPLVKTGRARTDQSAPHVGVSRRCEGFAVSQ